MVALLWVMPFANSPTGGLGETAPAEFEINIIKFNIDVSLLQKKNPLYYASLTLHYYGSHVLIRNNIRSWQN